MVGESGCGKTTIGKLLVKLLEPDEGQVLYRLADAPGDTPAISVVDPSTIAGKEMRDFRRNAQMIFQDPYESMNPRRTLFDIISEPLSVQKIGNLMERVGRVSEMLSQVGLTPRLGLHIPPSPRAFRRPAAAGCRRPRPRHPAAVRSRRRANLHARRVQQDGHHAADAAACSRPGHIVPLRDPRPRRRPVYVRPHRRDVPRQDSRAGGNRRAAAEPPSTPTPAPCSPPCRYPTPATAVRRPTFAAT